MQFKNAIRNFILQETVILTFSLNCTEYYKNKERRRKELRF